MQFGTAVHEAVQRFGILGHDVEAEDALGVMRDIAARTSPSPDQVKAVVTAALAIRRSEPLATAGRQGWRVEFEWPVLVPMTLTGKDIGGGGIIDILMITPDGPQIYDIKTDRSVPGAELIEHYRPLLTLYARAVEAVGAGPVTRAALIRSDGSVVDLAGVE